jgi:hypothetical protein
MVVFYSCFVYGDEISTRYGFSLNYGFTYDPSHTANFVSASCFALYDYDRVWPHKAPEPLRFKVEGNIGVGYLQNGDIRNVGGLGIMALYYLDSISPPHVRFYVEAGIGVGYTDYRVEEQAYRINFNPQAGIGFDWNIDSDTLCFAALRGHHLSNAGINDDNRGQNSVLFILGSYF